MGTRSLIAIQNTDGSVESIYCHWDGYPSGNGQILRDHYKTETKVRKLLALGSLSSLGKNLGRKHSFDYRDAFRDKERAARASGETYDMYEDPEYLKLNDMCLSYGRDRGETDVDADTFATPEEFWAMASDSWCEWAYLFADGEWYVSGVGGACGPFLVKRGDPDGQAPANWVKLADLCFDKRPGENYEPSDGRYAEYVAVSNCRQRTRPPKPAMKPKRKLNLTDA